MNEVAENLEEMPREWVEMFYKTEKGRALLAMVMDSRGDIKRNMLIGKAIERKKVIYDEKHGVYQWYCGLCCVFWIDACIVWEAMYGFKDEIR